MNEKTNPGLQADATKLTHNLLHAIEEFLHGIDGSKLDGIGSIEVIFSSLHRLMAHYILDFNIMLDPKNEYEFIKSCVAMNNNMKTQLAETLNRQGKKFYRERVKE